MLHGEALGLALGALALGAVHGIEPGHGWPVAASYALEQSNKWLSGLAASLLLGIGHLVSSIAMVGVFFYAKAYFELTQVDQPIALEVGGMTVEIGGPVSVVAGLVLIALGVYEYRGGHSHGHGTHGHDDHGHGDGGDADTEQSQAEPGGSVEVSVLEGGGPNHPHGHGHDHSDSHDHPHDHPHDHDHDGGGAEASVRSRLKHYLPFVGGHSHAHGDFDEAADRGLLGIAWFAFLLGFAHEEEFEIIALCAGSEFCLELMSIYALTVIAFIVALTLLLIAGYYRFEDRVERYTPYLPAFSAAVLGVMGAGFVLGLF